MYIYFISFCLEWACIFDAILYLFSWKMSGIPFISISEEIPSLHYALLLLHRSPHFHPFTFTESVNCFYLAHSHSRSTENIFVRITEPRGLFLRDMDSHYLYKFTECYEFICIPFSLALTNLGNTREFHRIHMPLDDTMSLIQTHWLMC